MKEPIFLERTQVLALHEEVLKILDGEEGIRDPGGLEAALAYPPHDYRHLQAGHSALAASYAFHLTEAQAFVSGNEGTALAAALTFLEMHGYDTTCDWTILHDAILSVKERRAGKEDLAALFHTLFRREDVA